VDPKLLATIIVGVIAALAVVVGAIISAPRVLRDPLASLEKLVGIYEKLPESPVKAQVLQRIEEQVAGLHSETSARRNPGGIMLGIIIFVLAGAVLWPALSYGGWWWLTSPASAFLIICGTVALYQNVPRVPRAANGQTLEYQRKQAEKAEAQK
jgi:hypothetical protein